MWCNGAFLMPFEVKWLNFLWLALHVNTYTCKARKLFHQWQHCSSCQEQKLGWFFVFNKSLKQQLYFSQDYILFLYHSFDHSFGVLWKCNSDPGFPRHRVVIRVLMNCYCCDRCYVVISGVTNLFDVCGWTLTMLWKCV